MPFKTKKRKIAALHNRVSYTTGGFVSYTRVLGSAKVDTESEKLVKGTGHVTLSEGLKVKSELVKIIVLAGAIIGLQIALKLSNLPIFK